MLIVLKIWKVQNHKYIDQAPKLCDEKVSVKNWLEKIEGHFSKISVIFLTERSLKTLLIRT